MILLKGTIQHGRVVLPQPADLPDGTGVTVVAHEHSKMLGIPDGEWPTDPEGIARLLVRMDRVEPFDLTPAEEAEVDGWRQKVKNYTFANQEKRIEGLFE
jgi:hypothetical protein